MAVTHEEAEFILEALELEPSLYLDEIQTHLHALTGPLHPIATIHNTMKLHLNLTSKKARTVHPAQCAIERASFISQIGFIPSDHLVFMGLS